MDTQNREQVPTQREKFAEPRGWAMKWVFTPEATHPTAEQETGSGSGVWEKFAEPRGWALKWDGFSLSEVGEPQNERSPSSTVKFR